MPWHWRYFGLHQGAQGTETQVADPRILPVRRGPFRRASPARGRKRLFDEENRQGRTARSYPRYSQWPGLCEPGVGHERVPKIARNTATTRLWESDTR